MGKNAPGKPHFAASIALLIEHKVEIIARCPRCDSWKPNVDLEAIGQAKGFGFSLWNVTTRCTFTPGCEGRVYFRYSTGFNDWQLGDR